MRPDFEQRRRHGKHCFCSACLQDEMNAMYEYIEELERREQALLKLGAGVED